MYSLSGSRLELWIYITCITRHFVRFVSTSPAWAAGRTEQAKAGRFRGRGGRNDASVRADAFAYSLIPWINERMERSESKYYTLGLCRPTTKVRAEFYLVVDTVLILVLFLISHSYPIFIHSHPEP